MKDNSHREARAIHAGAEESAARLARIKKAREDLARIRRIPRLFLAVLTLAFIGIIGAWGIFVAIGLGWKLAAWAWS